MELSQVFTFSYAILFIFLFIPYLIYRRSSRVSTPNLPPGNMGWPFVGETLSFLSHGQKGLPEKFMFDRMAKFSSKVFKTSLVGEPMLVFCGAQGNKFLFSNGNKLVTTWWPTNVFNIFQPNNDTSYPDENKILRKVFQDLVKPEAVKKFVGLMDMTAQRHFASSWENEEQVQVSPLAKRFTFSVGCLLFMSIEDPKEIVKLAEPFEMLAKGIFSLPINFPGTPLNRALKASRIIQKQLLEIVGQRKIDMKRPNYEATHDLLFHMLAFRDEEGQQMSEESIVSKMLALLLAGHDSASITITFIVKYLAELPHVYERVLGEQMEIAKSKAPGELLNWDDIQKMKYSWNVACEVLRLVPPLTGTFREAIKDFNYAGFSIPKGWKIHWSAVSTHKNPEYFPEPEKFDPSRFNGHGPAPYTYVPFGGGPRMCPGKEYARLETLVFMHNIVKRFKWEKLAHNETFGYEPFPTLANRLPIRLLPRKL